MSAMQHNLPLSPLVKGAVLLATLFVVFAVLSPTNASLRAGFASNDAVRLAETLSQPATNGGAIIGYWTNVTEPSAPQADWGAVVTYVPDLGSSLLLGGHVAPPSAEFLDEAWTYDVSLNAWARLIHSPPIPAGRAGAAVVYDPDVDKVVLFGGLFLQGNSICAGNDTWLYDPAKNSWANVTPLLSPPLRWQHSMVYDPIAHRVVLFGGLETDCQPRIPEYLGAKLDDTWTYDARTNVWTDVSSTVSPPGRFGAGMAYDPNRQAILLFGGAPIEQGYSGSWVLGDNWFLDSQSLTWTELQPIHTPSARYGQGMAYDDAARAVVLYGGCGTDECYRDTWWFNSTAAGWTEMLSARAPPFAPGQAFDYDPILTLVAYGKSETWQYRIVEGVDLITASASASMATAVSPAAIKFQGTVNGGVGPYSYAWAFGDGGSSIEAGPVHTYLTPGEYNVTLTVADATGASDTDSLRVSVAAPASASQWIPYVLLAAIFSVAVAGGGAWRWMKTHRRKYRVP